MSLRPLHARHNSCRLPLTPTRQVDAIGGARHDDASGDSEVQRTMLEVRMGSNTELTTAFEGAGNRELSRHGELWVAGGLATLACLACLHRPCCCFAIAAAAATNRRSSTSWTALTPAATSR